MKINKKKSGIIIHKESRRGRKRKVMEKEINGFPIVNSYKYLGIYLNE